MSKQWFVFGFLLSLKVAILGYFVPSLVGIAIVLEYLGLLFAIFALFLTNFGRGEWTQEGWSHTQQRPWNVPPNPAPRLAGFAVGIALIPTLVYVGAMAYVVLR